MAAEPIKLTDGPVAQPVAQSVQDCTCGESNEGQIVLDSRQIPHAIRHATIFGALDSLALGFSLDLVASHDPLPLLAQAKQRYADAFTTQYVERGPDAWTIRFTRLT